MKTLKSIISLVFCLLLMASAGCKKDRDGTGSMAVKMTDAPAAYSAVNVEVQSVEIHYADESKGNKGWVTLASNAGIYNLLDLQNDVTVVIADEKSLSLGAVTQLRLILGNHNTIESDGIVYELKVSSGYETGIKINLDVNIDFKEHIDVTLDFDANKSVVAEGNGSFTLKPVIQVESIVQN